MRKTTFVRTLSSYFILFCLIAFGKVCQPAIAQNASPTAAPANDSSVAATMPSDPKELMLLAAKINGLTGDDVKPWHLKVSFTVFDGWGNASNKGTFEEFWASAHKYKTAYTSKTFSQTDYGTEHGALRTGTQYSAPILLTQISNEFVSPLPVDEKLIEHLTFDLQKRKVVGNKCQCLTITGSTDSTLPHTFTGPTYCLDLNIPLLRISMRGGEMFQIVHKGDVSFQGRNLPLDLEGNRSLSTVGGAPAFRAHLESVDALKSFNESDFTPPADAIPAPIQVRIDSTKAQEQRLKQSAPIYPPIAQAARVEGTVVLKAIIGTNGRVIDLSIISGPAMLQQAARDAVQTWTYKPYLLNGEPAEVNTTINVVFAPGSIPHAIP
ncbi:MAG: energy transducer TonB [Terracidiphilus sp.]